jgi:hypothetical protein
MKEFTILWAQLGRLPDLQSVPLKVIMAGAALHICKGDKRRSAERTIEELETEYAHEHNPLLAIGIAYLQFHLWLCRGNVSVYRRGLHDSRLVTVDDEALAKKAIAYASYAAGELGPSDPHRPYALNQWLYYWTETDADTSQLPMLSAVAAQLEEYKQREGLWEYRYDDTLGRFLFRKSIGAKDIAQRRQLLGAAYQHMEWAYRDAGGDPTVEEFLSFLALWRSEH